MGVSCEEVARKISDLAAAEANIHLAGYRVYDDALDSFPTCNRGLRKFGNAVDRTGNLQQTAADTGNLLLGEQLAWNQKFCQSAGVRMIMQGRF